VDIVFDGDVVLDFDTDFDIKIEIEENISGY
jgi:hypothetical protein